MAEPTLQEILGSNATQDANTITISKADLIGLIAAAENTGESILISLVLTAQSQLTEENFNNNLDQSVYIERGISNFVTRDSQQYRSDQLTLNLSKVDTSNTINPDDY